MDKKDRRWPRQVRMSDAEYREACAIAAARGMSFSELVRSSLHSVPAPAAKRARQR